MDSVGHSEIEREKQRGRKRGSARARDSGGEGGRERSGCALPNNTPFAFIWSTGIDWLLMSMGSFITPLMAVLSANEAWLKRWFVFSLGPSRLTLPAVSGA